MIEIYVELANIIMRYKAAGTQLRMNLQGSKDTWSDTTVEEGSTSLDESDSSEDESDHSGHSSEEEGNLSSDNERLQSKCDIPIHTKLQM